MIGEHGAVERQAEVRPDLVLDTGVGGDEKQGGAVALAQYLW